MIWIFAALFVIYILFKFFGDLNKDNDDLQGRPLNEKFTVVVNMINDAAFNGNGKITIIDKREFNLYQDGQNQIINFLYSTGHLTITWKYKYFQKEVVHKKQFNNVRNISIFDQQRMGEIIISEMEGIVQNHIEDVLS